MVGTASPKGECFGWRSDLIDRNMVIVAELVKRLIVVQEIVGSSPTLHTNTSL